MKRILYAITLLAALAGWTNAALAQALDRSLCDKSVVELLWKQGAEPQFMDPAAFTRYVDSEITRWSAVVRTAGIKLD